MQDVSGVYTSPFLDTDERKMALRARKVSGAFEKRPQDTKNVSDFVQKHFVSATSIYQFAEPKKYHEQQCARNNVSSFGLYFMWMQFFPGFVS